MTICCDCYIHRYSSPFHVLRRLLHSKHRNSYFNSLSCILTTLSHLSQMGQSSSRFRRDHPQLQHPHNPSLLNPPITPTPQPLSSTLPSPSVPPTQAHEETQRVAEQESTRPLDNEQPTPRTTPLNNRSSVRRSLMNLVTKPATMTMRRNRVDSTPSTVDAERKRLSWRSSRRWSRARFDDVETQSPVAGSSSSVVVPDATSPNATPTGTGATATTTGVSLPIPEEAEKGKEREGQAEIDPLIVPGSSSNTEDQQLQPTTQTVDLSSQNSMFDTSDMGQSQLERSLQAPAQQTQAIPIPVIHQATCAPEPEPPFTTTTATTTVSDGSGVTTTRSMDHHSPPTATEGVTSSFDQPRGHGHEQQQSQVQQPPSQSSTLPPPQPPPPPPLPLPSQQQTPLTPPANRQFPPPGTLVVVQGIVHTTDVSRSGTTTNSNSNSNTNAGNNNSSNNNHTHFGSDPDSGINTGTSANENDRAREQSQSSSSNDYSISGSRPPALVERAETGVEGNAEGGSSGVGGEGSSSTEDSSTSESQQRSRDQQQSERSIISSSSIDVLGTLLRFVLRLYQKVTS